MLAQAGAAFRSLLVNLARSGPLAVAAVLCTSVTLSLAGAAVLVDRGVANATIRWRGGVETIVFMDPDASSTQVDAVGDMLKTNPNVAGVQFVSQQGALDEFNVMFRNTPALLEAVSPTALPASWRIVPVDGAGEAMIEKLGVDAGSSPGVYQVVYAKDAVTSVFRVSSFMRRTMVWLAGVLVVVQLLLMFAAARSSVFARRDEIRVMRAVGAPRWVVRAPFVLEGAVYGFVGSGVAGAVVHFGAQAVQRRVNDGGSLAILQYFSVGVHETNQVVAALAVAGTTLGAAAAFLGTRRAVRANEGRATTLRGRLVERCLRTVARRRVGKGSLSSREETSPAAKQPSRRSLLRASDPSR